MEKDRDSQSKSIRPWRHVLEPLHGYLLLAERLYLKGPAYAESWNFGPRDDDAKPVEWIVKRICEKWKSSLLRSSQQESSPRSSLLETGLFESKGKIRMAPEMDH